MGDTAYELTDAETAALYKERNARARQTINGLVNENERLRDKVAELEGQVDHYKDELFGVNG